MNPRSTSALRSDNCLTLRRGFVAESQTSHQDTAPDPSCSLKRLPVSQSLRCVGFNLCTTHKGRLNLTKFSKPSRKRIETKSTSCLNGSESRLNKKHSNAFNAKPLLQLEVSQTNGLFLLTFCALEKKRQHKHYLQGDIWRPASCPAAL